MRIRLHRITAAGLAVSLMTMSGGCGGNNKSPVKASLENYNVVLIVVDQEHYFSSYPEGSNYRARNLLAEMGTTFEKHYTCSNMSTSSRSVMFTGQHITHTGMIDNTDFPWQGAMSDSLRTIGDIMMDSGYYSAIKGKWHLGDATITGGESTLKDLYAYGFSDWGGTDYIGSLWQGHQKDPVIISEASEWLSTKGRELNAESKPFFLLLTVINPHDIMDYDITGYESPTLHLGGKPDDEIYNKSYNVPVSPSYSFDLTAETLPEGIRLYNHNWSILAGSITSKDIWKDYQDYYFNCIQDSDNNLMKVIDSLTENGMLDNTIIIFTADHGEMHGSHGLKGKGGFVYENNIHVPMIIVHPDFNGGRRVSALTSHVDIAATLADIAGASENLPGKSMLPLINGESDSIREGALFCYEMISMTTPCAVNEGNVTYQFGNIGRGMLRGITTEDYKFARWFSPLEFNMPETIEELFASNDVQLFDLKNDPEELNNLAEDRNANRELILRMNELLNAQIRKEIGNDDGEHVRKILNAILSSR